MSTRPDYNYLYRITRDVTPLQYDCGDLCGQICCRPNPENSLGMYLFPGEEIMFTGSEEWLKYEKHEPDLYDFPGNWTYPVYFIQCLRPCPRESRPLACRLFPLAPHLLGDGTLLIIYETMELPYRCPLITNKTTLREDFIDTVALAWREMLLDPRIYTLVEEDSRRRERELGDIPPVLRVRPLPGKRSPSPG